MRLSHSEKSLLIAAPYLASIKVHTEWVSSLELYAQGQTKQIYDLAPYIKIEGRHTGRSICAA